MSTVDHKVIDVSSLSLFNSNKEILAIYSMLAWTPAAENAEDWGGNAELEYLLLIWLGLVGSRL